MAKTMTRQEPVREIKPPRRVQITAELEGRSGYFKRGQFAYVMAVNNSGGMWWIDKDGDSPRGEDAYLISKSKDARGGALWISKDGFRFTGKG